MAGFDPAIQTGGAVQLDGRLLATFGDRVSFRIFLRMAKGGKQLPETGSPARRGRTAAIGKDTQVLSRAGFERAGFLESGLVLRWKEIVGPEVARIARPLRFTEGPSGGVLTLKADAAASVFLQHESRTLCGRINAYFGRDAVTRLRFIAGDIAPERKPPQMRAKAPEASPGDPAGQFSGSEPLKEALLSLARARRRDGNPK